jgi:hypothetical protein
MADENIELEVSGFKNLKAQIKEAQIEYQKLLSDVGATPQAIQAAAARVAELKDQFDDANDSVNALTGAGKFQAFGKGLTAVSGGFTAIQGAIGLAGGNAKEFEKTLLKVQSAMALTQGLSQLEDLGNAFTNMKKVAVGAFNSIKTAIGSTGIGLLVIALGAIYAYWDDIKAVVSGVDEEQKKLNADSAANLAMQEKQLNAISAQENILKLQGKSEEEIYQLKVDQYDATIKASKANLANLELTQKMQIEAAQRNKDILQGIIRFITAPLTLLLSTVDAVGEALGQDFGLEEGFSGGLASMIFDPEEVKKEGDKTIEEAKNALTKLENERAGLILQHDAKRDAEQKQREDKADAARKKEEDATRDSLERINALRNRYAELNAKNETEKQLLALRNQQAGERAKLESEIKFYQDKAKLTEAEETHLATLNEEYNLLKLSQDKEYQKKAKELYEANRLAIDQALADSLEEQKRLEEVAAVKKIEELKKLTHFEFEEINKRKDANGEIIYEIEQTTIDAALKRKDLNEQLNKDLAAIDKKYNQLKYEEDIKIFEATYDTQKRAAYKNFRDILEDKKSTDKQRIQAEKDLEAELLRIDLETVEAKIQNAVKLQIDITELEKERLELLKQIYEQDTNNRDEAYQKQFQNYVAVTEATLNAASLLTSNLLELNRIETDNKLANANLTEEQRENIAKESFERQKKLLYAMAVIDGAKAITSILAQYPKFDGGFAMAAALVLAAATTAFNLIKINKTQYQSTKLSTSSAGGAGSGGSGTSGSGGSKFAEGGLLTGRKHAEGGIPTPFGQLEGGEFVVNRSATSTFLPLLEKINGMGRGSGAPNNLSVVGEQSVQTQPMPIIKTYVVASEVSSQQEANKRINDIARL